MEGIYALHFLFKPNYFGNFAQNIIGMGQNIPYKYKRAIIHPMIKMNQCR